MSANRILLCACVGVFGACTVGQDYQRPNTPAPTAWQAVADTPLMPAADPAALDEWWTLFDDPLLNDLIEQAKPRSFDARMVLARIDAARAERRSLSAGQTPTLNGTIGANRRQNPFPGLGLPAVDGITFSLYELGFDAQWEIDFFGRLKRRLEAADASIEATEEEHRWVLANLSADITRVYWELRSLQRQLLFANQSVRLQRDTLAITQRRSSAGVDTRQNSLRASAQVAAGAARIPDLNAARIIAQRQLELLLALSPGELDARLATPTSHSPKTTPKILLSPAAVIRHRPDIQRAERQLAAATALKSAAIADLYPRISLAAFFGIRNTAIGSLFSVMSKSWSGGGGLLTPLFDGGRLRAVVDVNDAKIQEALANYEKTVLAALHETEIALTRLLEEERRRAALSIAVADLGEAAHLAGRRYQEGVCANVEVLDAELKLTQAEFELAVSEGLITTNAVAVFKTLGGGAPASPHLIAKLTEPRPD